MIRISGGEESYLLLLAGASQTLSDTEAETNRNFVKVESGMEKVELLIDAPEE